MTMGQFIKDSVVLILTSLRAFSTTIAYNQTGYKCHLLDGHKYFHHDPATAKSHSIVWVCCQKTILFMWVMFEALLFWDLINMS